MKAGEFSVEFALEKLRKYDQRELTGPLNMSPCDFATSDYKYCKYLHYYSCREYVHGSISRVYDLSRLFGYITFNGNVSISFVHHTAGQNDCRVKHLINKLAYGYLGWEPPKSHAVTLENNTININLDASYFKPLVINIITGLMKYGYLFMKDSNQDVLPSVEDMINALANNYGKAIMSNAYLPAYNTLVYIIFYHWALTSTSSSVGRTTRGLVPSLSISLGTDYISNGIVTHSFRRGGFSAYRLAEIFYDNFDELLSRKIPNTGITYAKEIFFQ